MMMNMDDNTYNVSENYSFIEIWYIYFYILVHIKPYEDTYYIHTQYNNRTDKKTDLVTIYLRHKIRELLVYSLQKR